MVRWLMAARKDGRWGNTQENASAMEALVDYYRKYEAEVPDFTARGDARARRRLARETFKGRSADGQRADDVPMAQLLARAPAGVRSSI